MIFADISNFSNVNDYLPILNGCLNAELILIFLVFHKIIDSFILKKWYKKFNLSAILVDVLILVIVIIIARFFYKFIFSEFTIWKFTGLAVCIQIIHDIIFYLFFTSVPKGYNFMLDFFNEYVKELGIGAIFGDSFMMIIACLLSSHFATYGKNSNIVSLFFSLYFIPYIINYEK
jgi:hypothetical protein